MGYSHGRVRGSSISLMIFSIILLIFYIGCSNSCRFEYTSLYSPIWTSLAGIAIASIGIGMTVTKREKTWMGTCFLTLSIICVFVCLGCMILALTAFFFEIRTPPSSSNQTISATLWVCMMVIAFVMTIISIVSSCMFCCCQEPSPVVQETRLVITGGIPTTGQTLTLNNQEFVLQPVSAAGAPTTVLPSDQPPPHSSVTSQPSPATNVTQSAATRPLPTPNTDGYMQLHQNPTAATSVTATSGEYAYVDDLIADNDTNRAGNPTSDEYYDDVGLPETSQGANASCKDGTMDLSCQANREKIPTPDECYAQVENPGGPAASQDPSASTETYSYARTDDLRQSPVVSSEGEPQYLNSGVQRPRTETSPQSDPKTPE